MAVTPAVAYPLSCRTSARVCSVAGSRLPSSSTRCSEGGSPVIRLMCAGRVQLEVETPFRNRAPSAASASILGVVERS